MLHSTPSPHRRALLAAGIGCAFAGPLAAQGAGADLAIVDARVLPAPDLPPLDAATVLVRNGRIVAVEAAARVTVPPGMPQLDARGAVLAAGYWNSHVHLLPLAGAAGQPAATLEAALAQLFTRWGFTTVFDIASLPGDALAIGARIDAGEFPGPRILTTGAPFFPRGGTPIYVRTLFARLGAPDLEVDDPAQAAARARRQLQNGADGVKLFTGAIVGGPVGVLPMDGALARAIAAVAHAAGKPVFAHPSNDAGLDIAVAAGVDVLAHPTATAGPWSEARIAQLVRAGVALTPTLHLHEVELAKEGVPPAVIQRLVDVARQQVGDFARAGGTLLFGTDVGYTDAVDPRREIELLAAAGLDWRAILATLTTAPAARFATGRRTGRVAPGHDADLVLLDGDPTQAVTAFATVRTTIRGGRVIHPPGR